MMQQGEKEGAAESRQLRVRMIADQPNERASVVVQSLIKVYTDAEHMQMLSFTALVMQRCHAMVWQYHGGCAGRRTRGACSTQ